MKEEKPKHSKEGIVEQTCYSWYAKALQSNTGGLNAMLQSGWHIRELYRPLGEDGVHLLILLERNKEFS